MIRIVSTDTDFEAFVERLLTRVPIVPVHFNGLTIQGNRWFGLATAGTPARRPTPIAVRL